MQFIEQRCRYLSPDADERIHLYVFNGWKCKGSHKKMKWDALRCLAAFVDGLLLSGPGLHFAYNWLEKKFPTTSHGSGSIQKAMPALLQVLVDEFLVDPGRFDICAK